MESNLSFFSLPFVDNGDVDFSKIKGPECDYDDLDPTLPSHGSLLGADDVLAQFLSGDEPLEEPDLNGPTTLHCEICRKQFDNAKKYYGHLRVHSKDNLWICDKCPNEKFATKQHLMKHSLTHKPLERVWSCPQCDMAFEALWRLQQHLFAKHLDYRPHKCDRCEMAFHKLSDLKKHKDIHDDVKQHECKICHRKFRDVSNLKRHMQCHTKEKPFVCPGCGNRYAQLASMRRHSQKCPLVKKGTQPVDSGMRNNYCRVCGLAFQYKSALLEHSVRQHSNNLPPAPSEDTIKNKSNELHVDTKHNIDTNQPITISKNTININEPHVNENNRPRIDANQLLNINNNPNNIIQPVITNSALNLATNETINNTPANMTTNSVILRNILLNIDPNRCNSTITGSLGNVDTIQSNNLIPHIDSNLTANINANPLNIDSSRVKIETNITLNIDSTRQHNVDTTRPLNIDTNRTVDNIVDDILSAEDDYLIRDPISSQMLYSQPEPDNTDSLMQTELLKDMNHMHILDDELLYNDIDFDSFQTMCNTNDMDYTDRNELLFDIADGRSIDQDIMNALYQVKGDNLPNELLNENEILNTNEKNNDFSNTPAVSVNECATIFESDVDLEASTNLAANLNQLIGENSVQYISTEHDDTFIISLNSEIDAEQLTDMLNIGVGSDENKNVKETNKENIDSALQPTVVTVENSSENDNTPKTSKQTVIQPIMVRSDADIKKETANVPIEPKIRMFKQRVLYVCRKCNRIFTKKDNYKSHRATHDASLRRHKCKVCGDRFGYKSTLNKHVKRLHTPAVAPAHQCNKCQKSYQAAWMLKRHIARDHDKDLPFECMEKDCGRKFYAQADLDVHKKFHINKKPYKCDICDRGFNLISHLKRHIRCTDCTKHVKLVVNDEKNLQFEVVLIRN